MHAVERFWGWGGVVCEWHDPSKPWLCLTRNGRMLELEFGIGHSLSGVYFALSVFRHPLDAEDR